PRGGGERRRARPRPRVDCDHVRRRRLLGDRRRRGLPLPPAMTSDPITTEIVRHALHSAAEQMKRALMRTAFSPIIYDVLDFAVAIYDREQRLLSQAPGLPNFLGTMGFCVEAAIEAAGGESRLEPGDVILYNYPYRSGS